MIGFAKPLLDLTAGDVMSRDVVTLARDLSLRSAAGILSRLQISGAPVVDEAGRCVGVLSATDFMNRTGGSGDAPRPRGGAPACYCSEWQLADTDALPEEGVERFMTADPVTVSPFTPLGAVARCLLDAHLHRVIVVNDHDQPVGVVTSTDLLAAVARTGLET
jgi:CBS domain-containing membrane protein